MVIICADIAKIYVKRTNERKIKMVKRITLALLAATVLGTSLSVSGSEDKNTPPKAEDIKIQTSESMTVVGNVPVYDAEQNAVRAVVVSAPLKGELKFTNGTRYTYTPFANQTGKDSFKCVFTDSAGAVGNTISGEITIEPSPKIVYADMKNNPSAYSAVKLCQKGIMSAQKIGGTYLFYPDKKVTKGEFILMALAAVGQTDFVACVNTKLKNDSDIPMWMKPAVKKAMELKIIRSESFDVNSALTRAYAAVIINRAAKIENVKSHTITFSDAYSVPKYAAQAYINLSAYKMLDLYDNKAHPKSLLKRSTAADMVWQLHKLYLAEKTK